MQKLIMKRVKRSAGLISSPVKVFCPLSCEIIQKKEFIMDIIRILLSILLTAGRIFTSGYRCSLLINILLTILAISQVLFTLFTSSPKSRW